MRVSHTLVAAATLLLTLSCGTAPQGPEPTGVLGFEVPTPAAATYVVGDSLKLSVDSPMGAMAMDRSSEMTLAMSFERVADGVQVTADVEAFAASMTNPMAAPVTADESDLAGALVFVVGPTGEVEPVSTPTISGAGAQLGSFMSVAYEFFPRLPGRTVEEGESWTETVAWSGGEGGTEITTTTAYTYTLAGDTTIAGQNLLRISVSGDTQTEISAAMEGMKVDQTLAGATTGEFFWDAERHRLHSADLERSLSGTVNLPALGMPPMPIKASGPIRTRLAR